MKLSRTERWILANQFAILEKLDPGQGYENLREILEAGYEAQYEWIAEHIRPDGDTMTQADCEEVLDILDMFTFLKYGYRDLADKSGIQVHWVNFPGFSGNDEAKYLGFTLFLIDRQKKFQDLDRRDNFNSHGPFLMIYRQMLKEWKKSADRYKLTKDDIIRITSVKVS